MSKVARNFNGQAKLTYDNIDVVKEQVLDGTTYYWAVIMKSGWISDTRIYQHRDERGRGICKYYPKDLLPKTVQRFIENHERKHFTTYERDAAPTLEVYSYGLE